MNQKELEVIANTCVHKIISSEVQKTPFKHIVTDNFFPENLIQNCIKAFPNLDNEIWEHENDIDIEIKSRTVWKSEFDIPDYIIDIVRILNCSLVMLAFSKVFDIPRLISDSYYTGGGLNVMQRGGLLDVHVDGNYHDATGLNRRLNAIVFLNLEWEQEWGGELGLYNNDGSELIKKIEPIFNRLFVFETHDYTYHGIPEPLNFPHEKNRKSIILYYYTKDSRPKSQKITNSPHSALWVKKNFKDKNGNLIRKTVK